MFGRRILFLLPANDHLLCRHLIIPVPDFRGSLLSMKSAYLQRGKHTSTTLPLVTSAGLEPASHQLPTLVKVGMLMRSTSTTFRRTASLSYELRWSGLSSLAR